MASRRAPNDFVNFTVNTRFASGLRLGGGVDTGRTVTDDCFAADPSLATSLYFSGTSANRSAQDRLYCHVVTPWSATLQVKAHGSYPLPGDVVVSGIFQNVEAPTIEANYPAPTALVVPSLGRNLAGGVRSVTVPLIEPQTQFEKRRTQLDLRLTKIFRVGAKVRLQANFDAYNVLNAKASCRSSTRMARGGDVPPGFWMPGCFSSAASWTSEERHGWGAQTVGTQ